MKYFTKTRQQNAVVLVYTLHYSLMYYIYQNKICDHAD